MNAKAEKNWPKYRRKKAIIFKRHDNGNFHEHFKGKSINAAKRESVILQRKEGGFLGCGILEVIRGN